MIGKIQTYVWELQRKWTIWVGVPKNWRRRWWLDMRELCITFNEELNSVKINIVTHKLHI